METCAFWALRYKTMQNHMEIMSTSNCWIRNMRLDQKSDAGHIQSYWWLSKLFKEAKNMRYWQPLRLSWLAHFGYVGTSSWATRNICFCFRLWLRFCSRVLSSLAFDIMLTSRQAEGAASHESDANLAAPPPKRQRRADAQQTFKLGRTLHSVFNFDAFDVNEYPILEHGHKGSPCHTDSLP